MTYTFPVPRSLMLNRSYSRRCIPQSATAWRVTGTDLMFKRPRSKKSNIQVTKPVRLTFWNYARYRFNRHSIPVAKTVRLHFNRGWFPDREFAPHLYSGRELLDILSGFRSGDLNLFNL